MISLSRTCFTTTTPPILFGRVFQYLPHLYDKSFLDFRGCKIWDSLKSLPKHHFSLQPTTPTMAVHAHRSIRLRSHIIFQYRSSFFFSEINSSRKWEWKLFLICRSYHPAVSFQTYWKATASTNKSHHQPWPCVLRPGFRSIKLKKSNTRNENVATWMLDFWSLLKRTRQG